MNSNWIYSPETLNLGQNWWFFVPCDLKIWRMTLKNMRAHLLCYFKLCALFHCHLWFQNGVKVRKCQIWSKIGTFLFRVILKFDRWPKKQQGTSSMLLQDLCIISYHGHLWNQNEVTVWKHQIWVKLVIFLPHVILKFDGWLWKTIGHLFYATSSFVHHFIAICELKLEL